MGKKKKGGKKESGDSGQPQKGQPSGDTSTSQQVQTEATQHGPQGLSQQGQSRLPQQGQQQMSQQRQQRMPQQGQQGMPQQGQQGMPQQRQQGMPQQGQPRMPQQWQPRMAQQGQQGQQGMPQQGQQGMPQQGQQGMPQQGQPGMPQQGQVRMPQQGPPGMSQPGQPGIAKKGQPRKSQQGEAENPQQERVSTSASSRSGTESPASSIVSSGGDVRRKAVKCNEFEVQYKLERTMGTKGRRMEVHTNHLALDLGRLETAVHYDVAIEPDRPKKLFYQVMEEFRLRNYPKYYPAFDGSKNLYSTRLLKEPRNEPLIDEVTVVEENEPRPRTFKVQIKFAAYIDLTELRRFFIKGSKILVPPMVAIQCIDIVLRQAPLMNFIKAGRSFFSKPREMFDLGEGMELYNGFYQSAVLGWKPFLNVDVSHKAFPKASPVTDLIIELYGDLKRPLRGTNELQRLLRNVKVIYEIPNVPGSKRNYRVNGVSDQTAASTKFKLDDGTTTTIVDYFRNVKNYRVNYPEMPCLWVGAKNSERRILLPVELCTVLPGQVVNTKMTDNQTRNMIKFSATSTFERRKKIMHSIEGAAFNQSKSVREFGLSVSSDFIKVEARVLDPPSLTYCDRKLVMPRAGTWRAMTFIKSAEINKWTILNLDYRTNPSLLNNLARTFAQEAQRMRIRCDRPIEPFENLTRNCNTGVLSGYFDKRKDHDLVIVVVPDNGPQYGQVKKAAEIYAGVLTQCIRARTVSRLNPSTIGNILLKVNAKRNGVNHELTKPPRCLVEAPCMLIGADVTHPSPDSDEPSVAAVVASHDTNAFKYNLCWRLQPSREEMIVDMKEITREQLMFFYKTTGYQPKHLIYIRDGVSDGQFEQVLNTEMVAIRDACRSMNANYKPPITFIVVQKRHHTRFFPSKENSGGDRNCNVPAGTCVDTTITNSRAQDFYLVSHASIQGVAKPTKYRVLWDDKNTSEDDLEELMYHLCHMFTRCTRSVSYPAPTYYAHLAAARGKVYYMADRSADGNLNKVQNELKIKDQIVKGLPMFFV